MKALFSYCFTGNERLAGEAATDSCLCRNWSQHGHMGVTTPIADCSDTT